MRHLRKGNYFVTRSSASHGTFDLVALKPKTVLLIQCKVRGYLSKSEKEEMLRDSEVAGGIPVLAFRNNRRRVVFRVVAEEDTTSPTGLAQRQVIL